MEDNKKKFMDWLKNVPKWPLRYNRGEVHPLTGKWPTQPSDTPHIVRTEWATEEEKAKMYPDEVSDKYGDYKEDAEKLRKEANMIEEIGKVQEKIKSMQEHPEQWKDRGSVQVETTEEQKEVLRKLQSDYGHRVIKNEQSGKELSLEEKMKVLKGIKVTGNPVETNLTGPSALTTEQILEHLQKLPEDTQMKLCEKLLLMNPAYKIGYDIVMKQIEEETERQRLAEQSQKSLDILNKVLVEEQLSKLPEELQVEIATRILDRVVVNKEVGEVPGNTWEKEVAEKYANKLRLDAEGLIGKSQGANYMQVVPNSQGYSALEQILESLKYLSWGYEVKPVPEEGIHINWPPISIEYMIKGIENTIAQYQLMDKKKLEEMHSQIIEYQLQIFNLNVEVGTHKKIVEKFINQQEDDRK